MFSADSIDVEGVAAFSAIFVVIVSGLDDDLTGSSVLGAGGVAIVVGVDDVTGVGFDVGSWDGATTDFRVPMAPRRTLRRGLPLVELEGRLFLYPSLNFWR